MGNSQQSEPVHVEVFVEAYGRVDTNIVEIDRAKWQAMTPQEQHEMCEEFREAHVANTAPSGYQVLNAEEP